MSDRKSLISDLPSVKFDGIWRVLGMIPSTLESKKNFPLFSSMMSPNNLNPSLWQETDFEWYKLNVWNQHMTSSCVAQSTTMGFQYCVKQLGKDFFELNPYFAYAFINNDKDRGAMITDAMRALQRFGCCLKEDLPLKVTFRRQLPAKAIENAKRFKLLKAYLCNNFEQICSAITLGFVVPLGIWVDNNFAKLDKEGISGTPVGRSGGGHAILGMGLKKSKRYGWVIKIQNSWGERFGMKGFSYIHKGHFERMHPDAFAIQSVNDDPLDATPENEVPIVK